MELPTGPERCYAAHLRGGDELVADDLATALPRTVASVEARTLLFVQPRTFSLPAPQPSEEVDLPGMARFPREWHGRHVDGCACVVRVHLDRVAGQPDHVDYGLAATVGAVRGSAHDVPALRGGHVDDGTWELIEATYDQEPRYA